VAAINISLPYTVSIIFPKQAYSLKKENS